MSKLVAFFTVLLCSTAAWAAPDLAVSFVGPGPVPVDASATYQVQVRNVGAHRSSAGTLTIELPRTNTSPQVYVLGTLGARSSNCALSGTTLSCSIGRIRKNRSVSVSFAIALPQSSAPIQMTAQINSAGDLVSGNNTATLTAALTNPSVSFTTPQTATLRHCTGRNLTSFYECERFPSSISGFPFSFEAGGDMIFPTAPSSISGLWSRPMNDARRLRIELFEDSFLGATFEGWAVSTSPGQRCFEGQTVFSPPSDYVAIYEVCLD